MGFEGNHSRKKDRESFGAQVGSSGAQAGILNGAIL